MTVPNSSTITYTSLYPMRANAQTSTLSQPDAPLESFTTSTADAPFRFDTLNFTGTNDGVTEPIQLQIRFPDEKTHFTAYYDDSLKQIVFPHQPPVQDPEDFLIAK